MKNRENKRGDEDIMNTKKAKWMSVFGICLFFAGFAFLIWLAVMEEYGLSNSVIISVAILGFIGCDILSIILLIKAFPGLVALDIEKIDKKYDEREMLVFPSMEKEVVVQKLFQHKFKYTEEGYYRKKKFSFLKDCICYYARIVDDISLENSIQRELNRFDLTEKKGKNFCLILFVQLDEFGEAEKKHIKKIGKLSIAIETINPLAEETVIVVAIDSGANTGYLFDIGNEKIITLYSHGYKMLRKIFLVQE